MDKSKRDPNDSPSSQTPENHRAKRLNTQGSPNAVDSTIEQDEQRFIRRTGPYVSYKPFITHEQWKSIIGSHVPLDRQTVAYHTSGWKAFVDFMARNIREGRSSMYDGNLELFIVCSRVYRCSPISIFSPLNGLSCDVPFSDQTFGDDTESAWWSTSVRKLTKILTHSVFRGNLSHLVTVIQYAIILRTDDRRRWVITKRSPIEGSMLEMLRSHIKYAEVENGMLKRPVRERYVQWMWRTLFMNPLPYGTSCHLSQQLSITLEHAPLEAYTTWVPLFITPQPLTSKMFNLPSTTPTGM